MNVNRSARFTGGDIAAPCPYLADQGAADVGERLQTARGTGNFFPGQRRPRTIGVARVLTLQTHIQTMNSNIALKLSLRILPVCALALVVGALTGCQTAGYQKSDAAAVDAQAAATAVQVESRALATTMGALNDLVNQPAPDARPQFQRFSAALDQLSAAAQRAEDKAEGLAQKRMAYFQAWDKEISTIKDEDIRNRSVARKSEVSTQFDFALQQYRDAENDVKPLIGYLQDIRKALSVDLTRGGLTSVQSPVTIAAGKADKAQTALNQCATELETLGGRMSSSKVADAKPAS